MVLASPFQEVNAHLLVFPLRYRVLAGTLLVVGDDDIHLYYIWHAGRKCSLRCCWWKVRQGSVDCVSCFVCGEARGRICGLLCGLVGLWTGLDW